MHIAWREQQQFNNGNGTVHSTYVSNGRLLKSSELLLEAAGLLIT
jgi:hypothetical protein